jgi:L-ascorbate metabolism protein UlaG (beta-lactamase superfamily)
VVVDDNLASLGSKGVTRAEDVALFTNSDAVSKGGKLTFNSPGEYEVGELSIVGIPAVPFMNDDSGKKVTMYKLIAGDVNVLVTGHILGDLSEDQLEKVGMVDALFVPVGNGGYTLDPIGALKLIRQIEPKLVIPTHYADSKLHYPIEQTELASAVKELAMEPRDTVTKLKLKSAELSDTTQLLIIES